MALGSILWLLGLICAVWVIYDVLVVNKNLSTEHKIIWVICAILFNILTAIIYYLIEKR